MKKIIFFLWLISFLSAGALAATSQQYYAAGLHLYQQRQYGQAVLYFNAAVQVDPNNWQAYQALGSGYYAEGDSARALNAYEKSLSLHPNPQLQAFDDQLRQKNSQAPVLPSRSAPSGSSGPVVGGGNFGIGLVGGEPGGFGATGKYWLDSQSAFEGALKINGTLFQFSYLWHDFDVIHPKRGAFPFYIGIGGDLAVGGGVGAGVYAPVGITYLFQKEDVPIDLFVEAQPTLWFINGLNFSIYGNLGARYYF